MKRDGDELYQLIPLFAAAIGISMIKPQGGESLRE
jgi:hypothetical protein